MFWVRRPKRYCPFDDHYLVFIADGWGCNGGGDRVVAMSSRINPARELAVRNIAQQTRQFPNLHPGPRKFGSGSDGQIESALGDSPVAEGRDAALAMAIEHAVARRWLTLSTVLGACLSRPWEEVESDLQAVLLVGASQMLLMDRVPDHAAINEAVEITKRLVRPKAAGLVNAVLRKVSRLRVEVVAEQDAARRDELPLHDGRAWRLAGNVFSEDEQERLGQRTSHGRALIARWRELYGWEETERLAEHSLVHAPIILAASEGDRLPWTDTPEAQIPGAGGAVTAHAQPGFGVFDGSRSGLEELLAANPGMRVQDPTAAAAVDATAGLTPKPELIVDACAGRGTKTAQLAAVHPEAKIIAADTDAHRAEVLRRAFADRDQVEVVEYRKLMEHAGRADLLVLDVPCSNTGVLARRVEAKYRFSAGTQKKLTDLQKQITADTFALLNDRGRVLYTTCSIDTDENERQAEWMCDQYRLKSVREAATLPQGQVGGPPEEYCDGGYFALMEKVE